MSPIADWYVNQLATYGLVVFIAVQGAVILAFCLGLAALLDWQADRREARRDLQAVIRAAERYANRQQRKEDRP